MKKLILILIQINLSNAFSVEEKADSTKSSYDEKEMISFIDGFFGKSNQDFYLGISSTIISNHNLFQLRAFFTEDALGDLALLYGYSHHKKYFLLNAGIGLSLTNTDDCYIVCLGNGRDYIPGFALYGESTLRYGILQLGIRTDININAEKPIIGLSLKLGFEITRIKRLIRSIFD